MTRPTRPRSTKAPISRLNFSVTDRYFPSRPTGPRYRAGRSLSTDYSSEDRISLEEMGFDEDIWLDQIDTVYSPSEDATYISVRTDSYEQSDLIRLARLGCAWLVRAEERRRCRAQLRQQGLGTVLADSASLKSPRLEYYLESGEILPLDVWVNDFEFRGRLRRRRGPDRQPHRRGPVPRRGRL